MNLSKKHVPSGLDNYLVRKKIRSSNPPVVLEYMTRINLQHDTINVFKKQIEKLQPQNCPCRLCKLYMQDLSFT